MKKRCIFHVPNYITPTARSGSSVRPVKMLHAFNNSGYDVDCVWGYGKERKQKIKEIKKNIKSGVKYDFVYSESSTMPTLLTERNHIPRYPFLDFSFLFFCKKHGIKIGLFYRDIQWKFPFYKESVSVIKRMLSIPLYHYDLFMYKKLLDVFYITTDRIWKYLPGGSELKKRREILIPGCDEKPVEMNVSEEKIKNKKLNIFYVGGITGIYDMTVFLDVISKREDINAIICCREEEWTKTKEQYEQYLTGNIKIVHASGSELEPYYEWADICSAYAGDGEYFSLATPIKIFEYAAKGKPILGVKNSESGDLIERENIGWCAKYSANALSTCLQYIVEHPYEIKQKKDKICKFALENTWIIRAKKVAQDLEEKS